MRPPAISRLRGTDASDGRERGVTMVLVALAMVAIIGMAALSIDIITLYLAREQAQRSADQAALAAARVISISGMTGDPNNSATWGLICGGPASPASLAAIAVATQSEGGGTPAVTYSAGGVGSQDCAAVPGAFGVNPLVTVKITHSSLPTFFSRIWGNPGNSVSATATAEAFNPSASDINTDGGATGVVIPVQPSCVKPLMVPNQNPYPLGCIGGPPPGGTCPKFVTLADGSIVNPGILPATPTGVIGEVFTLAADCGTSAGSCVLVNNPPRANGTVEPPPNPNLEYLPGSPPPSSVAVPSCATGGNGKNAEFEPAVAGCDQSTIYQCGVLSSVAATPNQIDLSESPTRPPPGDTANALACLMTNSTTLPLSGQDTLDRTAYPYKIIAGSANPLGAGINGSTITSSNSIISLPIYDDITADFSVNPTNVTIVGFLQVFVNDINDTDGSLQVTVLNVAGCGNNASTSGAVTGTSPVPVRLVTPP